MAVPYAALQATIDLLDSPATLLDLDGRIRHVNAANEKLLGRTVAELRGQPIEAILPVDLRKRTAALLALLLERGRLHGVFANERPDGTRVPVEVWAVVVPSSGGEPGWILATVRDLASQLEQLQQLNASAISLLTSPGDDLLVTIVRLARGLVGARYAALGVVEDGRLVRFIPDGISEAEIARIERWPDGHGLLGAMVTERRTIRVADIATDPRRSGFPAGHPPMHSFLGTPIQTQDEVYGHLYFTEKLAPPEFDFVDERLAELFASHAAIAIRDQRQRQRLEASERNLAEAQRIARIGSWDWDLGTDASRWSDETCRIFGIEPGTFGGMMEEFYAFAHPDDLATIRVTDRRSIEEGVPYDLTHRIVRPDGAVRIVHHEGEIVRDEAGRPVRMIGTTQDITERVAAEEERARLVLAVEQTADSIWVLRLDGTIEYVNPSFERLYGYRPEEVIGRNAEILNSGRHGPAFWSALWASVAAGQVWTGSIVNRRRDGTLVEVETVISAIHDAEGQVTSFVQADRDVSRERALEEQLRQSQKMEAIGQLAGGIAHDFNNLLTAIRGYGELARRGLPAADGHVRADLDEVIANADRAAELTRGLLAFSRRQVLQPRVVDPAAIVDGIAPLLRRLLGEHIELATSGVLDACCVRVDPSQLEQVIVNLAVNARDAMPAGGRLTIETGPVELDAEYARTHAEVAPGPYVALAVSDTGLGMDPETQARIFEPFFTTKPPGEGTGLGLATVYGFVKQSGGSIYVYSEPGAGTSFKLYLPRVEAPAEPTGELRAGSAPDVGSETVLLVEDDPAVRSFAARVLVERGYSVLEAPDAETALALVASQPGPIELLLTDLVMPGLSGREFAERLVADRPALRVLYMSGYAESHLGRSGTLAADIAYLPKPFSAEALARAVREALDARR